MKLTKFLLGVSSFVTSFLLVFVATCGPSIGSGFASVAGILAFICASVLLIEAI